MHMYFFRMRTVEKLHVPIAALFILFLSLYVFVWLVSVAARGISVASRGVFHCGAGILRSCCSGLGVPGLVATWHGGS